MKDIFPALIVLALSGCAIDAPISNAPIAQQVSVSSPEVMSGLKEAEFNLSSAVEVGALPASNRTLGCVRDALALGEKEEVKSFVPKTDTTLGKLSVIVIREQQIEQATKSGLQIDLNCEALIGRLFLRGVRDAGKIAPSVIPGANLIPGLLR